MFMQVQIQKTSAIVKDGVSIAKKDYVFMASFILAAGSCFISAPKIKYIDFKVIVSLFNLMIVIKAFEELKLMDKAAVSLIDRCKSRRTISLVLIFLCFFGSMLITNDVALITFVPLSIIIGRKTHIPMMETIILQTIAANIGSSLTPMGNPQNLFIFSFFNLSFVQFIRTMGIIGVLGLAWLCFLNFKLKNKSLKINLESVVLGDKKEIIVWVIIFLVILSSVFRIIDYRIAFVITILTVFFINKKLLLKVDYLLLITFVCFFIFIGNISQIKSLDEFLINNLNTSKASYFTSIAVSQFISNVPCSILLSHFTYKWKALLLGVNIGGIGTIIASLASVISYKLFIKENGSPKKYLCKFSIYNFVTLIVFTIAGFISI